MTYDNRFTDMGGGKTMTSRFAHRTVLRIGVVLLFVSFLLCYFGTLKGLISVWYNDEDYSYGFLIPLISIYLLWGRRKQFAFGTISNSWLGGIFFFLFLIVTVYGILGSSPSAVRPAIPLILLSITLFCFGTRMFRLLLFPFLFLLVMIPLPTVVQTNIGLPLKLLSTKLGETILRLLGVSVFVQGNVIDLGVIQLQVVDACSGLRYILPLVALGVLFAYFSEKVRWRQIVLVLVTIPIAIITNGIRIGATGILAQKYGSGVAEGFFHGFSAWAVFMFSFALLFGFSFVLKLVGESVSRGPSGSEPEHTAIILPVEKFSFLPLILCTLSLLIVGGLTYSTSALPRLAITNGLSGFPMKIGEWNGKRESVSPEIIALSGAEEALSVQYENNSGSVVSLYIGYRGSPFIESTNFFHSPDVCLPSSGFRTLKLVKRTIDHMPYFGSIVVREMMVQQLDQKSLVYYWFQTNKRSSHSVNLNRFHLALHALKRENTYDLFIRPITPIFPGESVEDAEKRMDQFVRDMMPVLLQFLKENQYEDV